MLRQCIFNDGGSFDESHLHLVGEPEAEYIRRMKITRGKLDKQKSAKLYYNIADKKYNQ